MTRNRHTTFLASAAAVALIALAASGCGSSSSGTPAAVVAPKSASGQAATIGAASVANLGNVLVDSQGRTVYLFQKDSGTTSACLGPCASAWPPIPANGNPTVGSGLNASLAGTATRSDGKPQVTYNGHPLYLFSGDQNPGDANGQGSTAFGGSWFALNAAGSPVTTRASSGSSGAGGGYGY
jgi:predicted lipoprotein with Yx(FWY)xxD motif